MADSQIISEFTCRLDRCQNIDSAMDVLAGTARQLGFRRTAYSYLRSARLPNGAWVAPPLLTRDFPQNWDEDWKQHAANDPYYHACFGGSLAVEWAEVRARKKLTAEESSCVRYLEEKGFDDGLTIPIHLAEGHFAFVTVLESVNIAWSEVLERSKEVIFVAAHHFHKVAGKKFPNPFLRARAVSLAQREIECLEWVARGKTMEDVASILNLSRETVRVHLDRAREKLDAVNRVNAVAKAAQLGLISASEGGASPDGRDQRENGLNKASGHKKPN
jgi:LuxR family transcriptional regulator